MSDGERSPPRTKCTAGKYVACSHHLGQYVKGPAGDSLRHYLKYTDQEPIGCQLCIAFDTVLKEGKDPPGDVQEGYDPRHGHPGKDVCERDLTKCGPEVVERLQIDQLIAVEPQVLFQTGHVRVV